MSDETLVPLFEDVWRSIDELCTGLSDAEWETPTALPGWTVKDNVAHMIGTESVLAGREVPDVDLGYAPHVKNMIGKANEPWVAALRATPGPEVLEKFREVTSERLSTLRGMAPSDFDKESWTPRGQGTYRDFMEVRIFDCWMHEQDIRRALDRPGHLDGPVVEQALDEVQRALPYVVGKQGRAPHGATVVIDITGPSGREVAIGVGGEPEKPRAAILDEVPDKPTVRITGDVATVMALAGGRITANEAALQAEGDTNLGARILANFAFVV